MWEHHISFPAREQGRLSAKGDGPAVLPELMASWVADQCVRPWTYIALTAILPARPLQKMPLGGWNAVRARGTLTGLRPQLFLCGLSDFFLHLHVARPISGRSRTYLVIALPWLRSSWPR